MPKINEQPNNKNTVVIVAILVAVVLAGLGYFAWQKSSDKAVHEATEPAAPQIEEQQLAEVAPPPSIPNQPPTPTPLPFPAVVPAPTPTATAPVDPCREATTRLQAFFSHLDQQEYVAGYPLKESSEQHFVRIAQKLYAHPPVVNRETDDLFTILTNSAHFYRILGRDDLLLIKDILNHESDNLETIMASFYHWAEMEQSCDVPSFALQLPLNSLYEYAGFFLNTLGGQSYLFRRESKTRMLIKYYAVLIIDRANEKGLNRHGIDIRVPLRSTIEEMEVSQSLHDRENYLETLLMMQAKYQEKYGNR